MAASKRNFSNLGTEMNNFHGKGASSRVLLDFAKLQNAGWTITERQDSSNKTHFVYVSPEGKTQKSAKDVARKLRDEGTLDHFLKDKDCAKQNEDNFAEHADVPSSSCSQACNADSDVDYEPPEKHKPFERIDKQ